MNFLKIRFKGSSNGKQCVTWCTLNGVRVVSLGPAEDQDPKLMAIRNGNAREMMNMVLSEKNPRNLLRPNNDGWTLAHEAAYYGQTECLRILIAAFPDTINNRTLKGQTPLILAVSRRHLACVKHLLESGADPSIPTTSYETPLYEACASCNARMVLLLVRNGADVNQKFSDGWTALHESVSQNSLELCEILVRQDAKVNSPNIYGVTGVFLAAQCGCVKPLQFLVKNGCVFKAVISDTPSGDINREAKDGATALYEACKNDHEEIVEFLLSLNADTNKPGKDGLLPLQIAAKNGSYGASTVSHAAVQAEDSPVTGNEETEEHQGTGPSRKVT